MNEKTEKLMQKIHFELEQAERRYNGEWDDAHRVRMAKIEGLISALEIMTDKVYLICGTELKEYKGV